MSDQQAQRRRVPPPSSLNLPEPTNERRDLRPPSPLRNGVTMDPTTGEISEDGSSVHDGDDDGRMWGQRSHSPTPSMAKMASDFAQRMGSLVSNSSSRARLPTDAELEAEAERERERSRREAELIMMRDRDREDTEERMLVEERVMALLHTSNTSPTFMDMPPPPERSQTMQNPPSPASSQKESSGWFAAVKNKLTPTKDPLTPAQQIILDTKAKEKERKKSKDKDWPATSNNKFSDPAFLNLASSATTPPRAPTTPYSQTSPQTPSPAPRTMSQPPMPDFSPSSFNRSVDSPNREQPPIYAQFNAQGVLDVHDTLLTIARRFEKLERWTVGHVRALEERMSDVERWLVDKEKEKEKDKEAKSIEQERTSLNDSIPPVQDDRELSEIRDELAELSGRVSELGREMAKFATTSSNLSSGPSRSVASSIVAPATVTPSAVATKGTSPVPSPVKRADSVSKAAEPVSPPMLSKLPSSNSRTRLPYPTGDYTSPPGSVMKQEPMSPTSSPPPQITQATRTRPISIAGLPSSASFSRTGSTVASSPSSMSGLPSAGSPIGRAMSPSSSMTNLRSNMRSPPSGGSPSRPLNASPTPRKRYTVALGVPIVKSNRDSLTSTDEESTYHRANFLSRSPVSTPSITGDEDSSDANDDDDDAVFRGHSREETVGKSSGKDDTIGKTSGKALADAVGRSKPLPGHAFKPPPAARRVRPQSTYTLPSQSSLLAPASTTDSTQKARLRSRSTDRFGPAIESTPVTPVTGKFVDPLFIRKKSQDALPKTPSKAATGRSRAPVGELVAFFNTTKQ